MSQSNTTKAATYDEGKEPLAHLPWGGLDEVSRVQAYGHKKYKDFNNYRKGMEVSRNLSCAIRHIRDYMDGQNTDHESGLNPLAHAACRLLFVLQNLKDGVAIDDRYCAASRPNTGQHHFGPEVLGVDNSNGVCGCSHNQLRTNS